VADGGTPQGGAFAARTLIGEQPPAQDFLPTHIDAVVLPALGSTTA
jgi:hypothetical protein